MQKYPEKIENIFKEEIEKSKYPVVAAIYKNKYVSLETKIENANDVKDVKLIDISNKQGMRIYKRTLIFLLAKVLRELYPENETVVSYRLTNAIYCELGDINVTDELVQEINDKMRKLIKKSLPITEKIMTREDYNMK